MGKISRILGATGIFALAIGLSGCATVSVRAQIIDDTNAVVAMQEVITHEGFIEYLEQKQKDIESYNSNAIAQGSDDDEPEEAAAPDLSGIWSEVANDEGFTSAQEIDISGDKITIYQYVNGGGRDLFWSGSYDPPKISTLNYAWDSKWNYDDAANFIYKGAEEIKFIWQDGVLSYSQNGSLGATTLVNFEPVVPVVIPEEETPEEETENTVELLPELVIPTTADELCDLFKSESGNLLKLPTGIEAAVECTDVDYAVTVEYPVTYSYAGVKQIAGVDASKNDIALLPFTLATDAVYGDVVFEHRILGLELSQFRTSTAWLEAVTDYNVSVSFPGEITEFSNEGIQDSPNSVYWDYALVKSSVENGDYTLTAAGRADARVDPIPIILTVAGVLFLLLLLVYFMWKRFSARTIAITSFFLAILSPFGFALALVARKKARNNADGAQLAFIALIVSSASLVFQALVVILFLIMAPQLVQELLATLGLVSSTA